MALVEVEVRGPVRRVLLNRAEKRNALNPEMISLLNEAFTAPLKQGERLMLIEAAGPSFSAGLDLRERDGRAQGIKPFEEMLHALETYPLPVVAAVQGAAIAGGNELALHCDLVVASTAAKFGMSPAQIGLAPSWFLCKKLQEVAGPVATRRILFLGDPLSAREIYDLGIISHIAEPDQLQGTVDRIVERLAANAPLSLKALKAVLVRQMTFRDGIAHEDLDEMLGRVRESEDAREGIAAFLERRKPNFQER
ncbi:MAG TPA: enoyl-CoA hydratase/isomerase family protein [Hyphomicrobiaceae bacterium]|nr:enoyl-CoA hydratase/isomerase family protein [Hyphomicrobiaceae bacterium]